MFELFQMISGNLMIVFFHFGLRGVVVGVALVAGKNGLFGWALAEGIHMLSAVNSIGMKGQ